LSLLKKNSAPGVPWKMPASAVKTPNCKLP
jgi:hypothetical protein